MEMLNLQDFMLQQIEDRIKAMRKRERKRLDKIERRTPARNPLGQAMWNKGHPVENVDTKYNRKKIKKAVDVYRDTEV
tara:strand:- start:214 stop:447 length:234 start_codon:yes stop_codon:yes gene_type:complete